MEADRVLDADNQPIYEITVAGDGVVAYVEAHDDTDRANANLIALAPDMASMLRELEWAGICEGRRNQCCACLNFQDEGHTPDCRLSSLLAELPK